MAVAGQRKPVTRNDDDDDTFLVNSANKIFCMVSGY
jgi:hypothetical protein